VIPPASRLVVLLTAFSLREAYLRPLLSIFVNAWENICKSMLWRFLQDGRQEAFGRIIEWHILMARWEHAIAEQELKINAKFIIETSSIRRVSDSFAFRLFSFARLRVLVGCGCAHFPQLRARLIFKACVAH
jgi:hypothetical protein